MLFRQLFSCLGDFPRLFGRVPVQAFHRVGVARYRAAIYCFYVQLIQDIKVRRMNRELARTVTAKSTAIAQWRAMLGDDIALLAKPGAHHKALLKQAHALHQDQLIDSNDLSDLLELADGALAYAVESLLDIERNK